MKTPDLDRLGEVRTDWTLDEARALFALPFNDLLYHALRVHRLAFDPNRVQVSTKVQETFCHTFQFMRWLLILDGYGEP